MTAFSTRFIAQAALLLAGSLVFAAPASAEAPSKAPRSISVKYSDLDLAARGGQDELKRRVERAVKRVCAPSDDKQLRLVLEARACREATLASADVGLRQAIASAENNRHIGG